MHVIIHLLSRIGHACIRVQQIQVHVVSYAFKMRNGMQLGECTLLLDDLVGVGEGRTVMSLL